MVGLPLCVWGAGEPADSARRAPVSLDQPGVRLIPGENEAAWGPLLRALADKGSVFATFSEQRWFSFRRDPVRLTGEMRMSVDAGMSLRYLEPDEKMMIVDSKGIVLRNARGRSRVLKPDADSMNTGEALLQVMRFDLEGLVKDFALYAAGDREAWRFDFMPRDEELSDKVGAITVWGAGEAVSRLEMNPDKGPRIEITIENAREGVVFTEAERQKFFR